MPIACPLRLPNRHRHRRQPRHRRGDRAPPAPAGPRGPCRRPLGRAAEGAGRARPAAGRWRIDIADRDAVLAAFGATRRRRAGQQRLAAGALDAGVGSRARRHRRAGRRQHPRHAELPRRHGARHEGARLGHIVNLGSMAGSWIFPGMPVYAMTKAAIHSLSHTLRLDLHGSGVRVSEISPGPGRDRRASRPDGGPRRGPPPLLSKATTACCPRTSPRRHLRASARRSAWT